MDQKQIEIEEPQKYQKMHKQIVDLKPNLLILDISRIKLDNLDAIKDQLQLQILIAEQNTLTNNVFKELKVFKQLKILSLQDNHIVDHTHLEQIAELPLLELRLLYNRIASLPQYYRKVYEILPNLMTLDDYDRDGLMVNDLFQ
ncbi:hypothetical protein pb186bvf_001199 [Paramecium bursaria]